MACTNLRCQMDRKMLEDHHVQQFARVFHASLKCHMSDNIKQLWSSRMTSDKEYETRVRRQLLVATVSKRKCTHCLSCKTHLLVYCHLLSFYNKLLHIFCHF